VCDPKCSHFKGGIITPYSWMVNYPKALKILKISEHFFLGAKHSVMDVHLNRNHHKPKQSPTLKHTK
jgi:hypothetical protein